MASSGAATPKLSLDDILAFSEIELVQYMKQNQRPDGGFDLEFDGWENLPKDQREQLAERLRAGAQKATDGVQSRPVNLDHVAARLHEISHTQDMLPQALSGAKRHERSPTVDIDWDEKIKQRETIAYNDLVNGGGRPLYTISHLEEVWEHPETYREMLLVWQRYPDASTSGWKNVFQGQLERWQEFRDWQDHRRHIYDAEKGYLAYFEEMRREYVNDGRIQRLSELEADPLSLMSEWEHMQEARKRDRYWLREDRGRASFPEYVDEVKRRLAQHGFTRPFQLDEDPKRQDRLTTWIEYLNYEYSWYDRYSRSIKRLRPKYDEDWKELVDSGWLQPFETDQSIRTTECALRCEFEQEQAQQAVESAEAEAKAALGETEKASIDPRRSPFTKEERMQRLSATLSRLVVAKNLLKAIKTRGDLITAFIRGTWDYERAKKNAERHNILLGWILKQVPLIEAEVIQSKVAEVAEIASNVGRLEESSRTDRGEITNARTSTKRKRNDLNSLSDDISTPTQAREPWNRRLRHNTTNDRPLKRLRNEDQNSNSQNATTMNTRKGPTDRQLTRANISLSPAFPRQLRRSARIKASQDAAAHALEMTTNEDHSARPHQKRGRKRQTKATKREDDRSASNQKGNLRKQVD